MTEVNNNVAHTKSVSEFYTAWSTQSFEEIESRFNGCYAACVIDGVKYLDCELYGRLNSVDNREAVEIIVADKKTLRLSNDALLERKLITRDDSMLNEEGERIGVVRILDADRKERWVAEVYTYGTAKGDFPDHSEALIMAKLLAAAPDLLQACIDIQKRLTSAGEFYCKEVAEMLKNAIKKATA